MEKIVIARCALSALWFLAFGALAPFSYADPAKGALTEWEKLNEEVMSLYRQGEYDRAVVVAKKTLEVAEKGVGKNHPSVATSLNNLALLYDTQGEYAKAEPLYKRALAIWEKALGPDHPSVATNLNNRNCLPPSSDFTLMADKPMDGRDAWPAGLSWMHRASC